MSNTSEFRLGIASSPSELEIWYAETSGCCSLLQEMPTCACFSGRSFYHRHVGSPCPSRELAASSYPADRKDQRGIEERCSSVSLTCSSGIGLALRLVRIRKTSKSMMSCACISFRKEPEARLHVTVFGRPHERACYGKRLSKLDEAETISG